MQMKSSDKYSNIPSICRLLAHVISAFVSDDSPSRRDVSWNLLENICDSLDELAAAVCEQWVNCPLSRVENDEGIGKQCAFQIIFRVATDKAIVLDTDSLELATGIWQCLKTLMFAIVTIQLSVLKVVLHLQPPPIASNRLRKYGRELDAPTLCKQIVHTLSRLSFVMMQLGGVSAMPSEAKHSNEYQFKELKQAFFLAMDVISAHKIKAEGLVKEVARSCGPPDGSCL